MPRKYMKIILVHSLLISFYRFSLLLFSNKSVLEAKKMSQLFSHKFNSYLYNCLVA